MHNNEPPVWGLMLIFSLMILMVISLWKIFEKAGEPGWAALIPIYNFIILLKVGDKEAWWIVVWLLIPIVAVFVAAEGLAKNFSKKSGFMVGLVFLPFIFYPILAFGDAVYKGERREIPNDLIDQV